MNFTREPILETIIAAKEGFKLKLKSTKNEAGTEFLVDAVEVVCLGTTFFYRSGEPAHTFFVPAQDFEIQQVRQARLLLKTPTEKAIKIAGGAEAGKKPSADRSKDNRKQPAGRGSKAPEKKVEPNKLEPKASIKEERKPLEKKEVKNRVERKTIKKSPPSKTLKRAPRGNEEGNANSEEVQPSIFSHLLRPPEALISDSIHKYQDIIDDQQEQKIKREADLGSVQAQPPMPTPGEKVNPSIDDPELKSEAPKPFEKLEEGVEEKKPLSLKEKMKKVLAPSVKEPTPEKD